MFEDMPSGIEKVNERIVLIGITQALLYYYELKHIINSMDLAIWKDQIESNKANEICKIDAMRKIKCHKRCRVNLIIHKLYAFFFKKII